MSNRAARRREARAAEKRRSTVLIAGDGVVATALGQRFEAVPHRDLPEKVDGEHRWIATAAYVIGMDVVEGAFDVEKIKHLDHENLFSLAIGCFDCCQPLGVIEVGSWCPGDDES